MPEYTSSAMEKQSGSLSGVPGTLRRGMMGLAGVLLLMGVAACNSGGTPEESLSGTDIQCDPNDGSLTLPDGFCAVVVADDLGQVRHITVRDNGDLYAALREMDGGGIVALRDTDGDGKADIERRFGDSGGTGIGIRDGHLYFAPDTAVWRYPMTEGELVPTGSRETVVTGFPEQGQHAVKPFAFDGDGNMYVNVGGPSNACQEQMRTEGSPGQDPCPQLERHAGVWRFAADQLNQTQTGDGQHYATGIRNGVAITWNDAVGSLYVVQHGRDQLNSLWPDLFTQEQSNQLPAEEFFQVNEGDNFGWPYCYYDWQQEKKVLAPEYGGDGKEVGRCSKFEDPIAAFPGHWAPNDVMFYTGSQFPDRYQNGAFIAFHGSWNRSPQQAGYQIAFVPFEGGNPAGEYETFADGFAGEGDWRPESPGDAEYRPMGLAQGPDGSLYISESAQGRIWRVVYTGS